MNAHSLYIRTLITLALCIGIQLTQAKTQPDSCIFDIQTAKINETSLHYIECGEGKLLVFVYGAFGDLVSSFGEQIETFARDFLHYHLKIVTHCFTKP